MKYLPSKRRAPPSHIDDWLMTYADMITLLLCFFAIFISVSVIKKDNVRRVDLTAATAQVSAKTETAPLSQELMPVPVALKTDLKIQRSVVGEEAVYPTKSEPVVRAETTSDVAVPAVAVEPAVEQGATFVPVFTETINPVKAPPQPVAPPHELGGDRITMLEMNSAAFFDSGSAVLRMPGKIILQGLMTKLSQEEFKDYQIAVEGHTDDTPITTAQFPSNWELSTARAAAVVRFFLEQGISPQRLRAAGYADTFPKLPNRDAHGGPIPENQAQNRRVVIKLEKIEKDITTEMPRPAGQL